MNTGWNRVPALLGMAFLLASLPAVAGSGVVPLANPHKKSVEKVWTADRFAAARPLPMQAADRDGLEGIPEASSWLADESAAGFSAGGRAPIAGIRADGTNRLFEAEDREMALAVEEDLGS